ncbi:MAG: hypothetical protein ACF8NJ_05555 [Phycisphaerales bacterium JB038]
MISTAMLPPLPPPTTTAPQAPAVFVDEALRPDLYCLELTAAGVLDEREAVLALRPTLDPACPTQAGEALRLLDATAEVSWLLRIGDTGAHQHRFLSGSIEELTAQLSGDAADTRLRLRDRWSLILDQTIRDSWWASSGGAAVQRNLTATTRLTPAANRSRQRYLVNGRSTPVFEEGGVPWRLFDLLVYLSVAFDLNLPPDLIDRDQLWRELSFELPLQGTLRQVLTVLLGATGLQLDRRQGESSARRGHRLRAITRGRPVTLTLADREAARSLVERFRAVLEREQETALLGPREPRRLSGAFLPQASWDEALEGEPAGTYDRDHPDFATYAEVYRRWRLPGDDAQLQPLYPDGAAPAEAPRFRPRGDGGRCDPATGVLVEYSLDSGAAWADYNDEFTLAAGRAEVYLRAAALPAGFAAAGSAGTLRLRLTAALRRTDAPGARRILGNVFLSDQQDNDDDTGAGSHTGGGAAPYDDDDDDLTLPGQGGPAGDPADDDDDDDGAIAHGPNDYFAGQPRPPRTRGAIEVTIGPVDPGLEVGDLVTRVRGGKSPSVYVRQTGPLRVDRIKHDLAGRQQTTIWLTPVRVVE